MPKAKGPTKSTVKTAHKSAAKPAPKSAAKAKPTPSSPPKVEHKASTPKPEPKPRSAGNGQRGSFLLRQKDRLLALRDSLLDSMAGVSKDTLRSRAEGSEASAFGMHQADAGSDAYDRDFALNLLSQEQDALYEIDEALKRVEQGTYGVCEMSAKPIPHPRLEAIPFARYTVECQTEIEKQNRGLRARRPVTSLFGLGDDEGGGDDEEDISTDNKE